MRKNRGKILNRIAVIFLLAGAAMLLYPRIQQYRYDNTAGDVVEAFSQRIEDTGKKNDNAGDWTQLKEWMVQYNEALYAQKQKDLKDAFSYQEIDFNLKQAGFEEEMIGYITIPRMEVELPIYLGANTENLSKGAAQLTQTSLPVGGVNTNAVLAAHRGFKGAAMFRDIEKLESGDLVMLTNFQETLYYQAVEMKVIAPSDIKEVLIQEGRDMLTLITCHPYRNNYQRYVVYCERIENPDDISEEDKNPKAVSMDHLSSTQQQILLEEILSNTGIVLLFLTAMFLLFSRKKRK